MYVVPSEESDVASGAFVYDAAYLYDADGKLTGIEYVRGIGADGVDWSAIENAPSEFIGLYNSKDRWPHGAEWDMECSA